MAIVIFGSRGEKSSVCEAVDICMKLESGHVKDLTMFVICEALTYQPITLCRDSYKNLAGLPLADLSDGTYALEVDILIGCDYFWNFITGETKCGGSGPMGVHTELGWALSGPIGPIPCAGRQTTHSSSRMCPTAE